MIFLVDASVYVFRAYHSQLPDMVDRDGNPVHAVFGFARFLGDLMERIRPRYIGVAFDQRLTTSYRNRIYPAYKANREPTPAGLPRQFEYCRELCRHLGLPTFVDPDFEADDIIGTLSCLMRAEGIRSAFITRDKDMAQLVRDGDLLWDFGARTQIGLSRRRALLRRRARRLRRLPRPHRRRLGQHSGRARHRAEDRGHADAKIRLAR